MILVDQFKYLLSIEDMKVRAHEELKLYCERFKLELPTYTIFCELIENERLTAHHNLEESIQVVSNELMPYRYSYCDISQLGGKSKWRILYLN